MVSQSIGTILLTLFVAGILVVCSPTVQSWTNVVLPFTSFQGTRCFTTLTMKRGRGSIGKEVGIDTGSGSGGSEFKGLGSKDSVSVGSSSSSASSVNWIPIAATTKQLPTEENKVNLIDTNLITIKNGQTNPTGAVSVIKYSGVTYCFAVNCPSCKIPLTKAQVVEGTVESNGQPRIVCDLCKSTYNLQTGTKLSSAVQNPGFFGGIAKTLFSAQGSGNLPTYKLGEKGGKLLIAFNEL